MNPFKEYKDKSGLTWIQLMERCDLFSSQVGYIMKMNDKQLEKLTLGAAARIKLGTNVDLFDFVLEGEKAKRRTQ